MAELSAKGVGGQLEIDGAYVVPKRKGALAKMTHGLKGDKRIRIDSISAIQMKPATALTRGYIQFVLSGSDESKGGLLDATRDENSVLFSKKEQPAFEAIRSYIESRQRPPVAAGAGGASVADELRKLAGLRDEGILTEEEFQAKKKELLG